MKLYSYLDFMRMVTIPEPCAMKLSQMSTVEGGHYCGSCSKVVIDFSTKSNEEIAELLRSRAGHKTCGVFLPSQVIRPRKKFLLVRIAAALILSLGGLLFPGCKNEPKVVGEICVEPDSLTLLRQQAQLRADSTRLADSLTKTDTTCHEK